MSLAEKAGDFVVSAAADLVLQRVGGKAVERIAKSIDGKSETSHVDSGGSAKGAATALQDFGGRTANDLVAAAAEPINKEGLTKAARALTKHASGQRATGTFPKLTGGIDSQNSVAQKIVDGIISDPRAVYTNLSRGGLEIRVPDGRGIRYNGYGSFSTFLDPKL